jgi:hypothetical protein
MPDPTVALCYSKAFAAIPKGIRMLGTHHLLLFVLSGLLLNTVPARARPARQWGEVPGLEIPATVIWLFSLTRFHAHIVFGLACLCRIIFCARLLLIATLLATARLFGLYCSDAAKTEQHDDNSSDGSHGDLLSIQPTAWRIIEHLNLTQFFPVAIKFGVYLSGRPTIRLRGQGD